MDYLSLKKQYREALQKMNEAEVAMKVITDQEEHRVVALAAKKSKKYREAWARAARDGRLTLNVSHILESCYDTLCDAGEVGEVVAENAKKFREVDSAEWREFVFKLIQHLFKKKAFDEEDGSIDDFDDTAGGCDEVVWNAAVELLEKK
jgi:hypothetical protein